MANARGAKTRKLALLYVLVACAGLSVRAQDVAAGCQGTNSELIECAGNRAGAVDRLQDRIYHIIMDALIAGGDDRVDPLADQGFGFLRRSLPKSQQQWTKYRDTQCDVAQGLYFGASVAAVGGAVGSAGASLAWRFAGWAAVCTFGQSWSQSPLACMLALVSAIVATRIPRWKKNPDDRA